MTGEPVTGAQWLAAFAEEAGVPAPTPYEVETLLSLAGVAAHASERIAAPITCWLAARAGLTPDAALAIATRISQHD